MTKVLENKKTELAFSAEIVANYSDLASHVINSTPLNLTANNIKLDLQLLSKLEDRDAESFTLSVTELTRLSQLLKNTVWPIRHNDIVEFSDYVNGLITKP